jgi:hypothetical protein
LDKRIERNLYDLLETLIKRDRLHSR